MLEEFYDTVDHGEDWQAFRSDGYLHNAKIAGQNGEIIPMEKLPPLLRTLLVTDGTVTKALEAYFWEAVNVEVVKLDVRRSEKPIPWLNTTADAQLLTRKVQLIGHSSQRLYATAYSVVKLNAFEKTLQEKLIHGQVGIGVLLRESGLETYREILKVGIENCNGAATDLERCIYRTYRIMRDKKPVILIRESFPWRVYSAAGDRSILDIVN